MEALVTLRLGSHNPISHPLLYVELNLLWAKFCRVNFIELLIEKVACIQVLPTTMTPVSEDEYGGGYFTEMNGSLEEVHPVERGMIKDWDAMEDLWRYALYTGVGWEIGNEGQVLVAEPLLIPKVILSYSLCRY